MEKECPKCHHVNTENMVLDSYPPIYCFTCEECKESYSHKNTYAEDLEALKHTICQDGLTAAEIQVYRSGGLDPTPRDLGMNDPLLLGVLAYKDRLIKAATEPTERNLRRADYILNHYSNSRADILSLAKSLDKDDADFTCEM